MLQYRVFHKKVKGVEIYREKYYWLRFDGWFLFGFIPLYVRQIGYVDIQQ